MDGQSADVRAGTLDDRRPVADVHIFTKSKLPWLELSKSIPTFEVYYERSELWSSASIHRIDAVIAQRTIGAEAD